MIHRITTQRDRNAGTEIAPGAKAPADFQDYLLQIPARAWSTDGQTGRGGGEQFTAATAEVFGNWRVMVTKDTDVTEADRIATVKDRDGTVLAVELDIQKVVPQPSYLLLLCQERR